MLWSRNRNTQGAIMTNPIIVGLALREDDAAPLAVARTIARLTGAPLELVMAIPCEAYAPIASPDYARSLRTETERRLGEVADGLRADHTVGITVEFGSRAGMLHDRAVATGARAVVVGSSHHGPAGRVLAGDVAAGLLHGAPCPVIVAPRGDATVPSGLALIGVAYTDSDESREALAAAVALARLGGAVIKLLAVVEPEDYTAAYAVPGWVPPTDDVRTLLEQRAGEVTAAAIATLPPGVAATSEVLHGHAVAELRRASGDLDLLVCGSRGYGALRGAIAGSVSRGLAHGAGCPLLLVPRGTGTEPEHLFGVAAEASTG